MPLYTQNAPWISSKNRYLDAKSCVWPSWIQNKALRPYSYNTHLKYGAYVHYNICPKMSVELWKPYIVQQTIITHYKSKYVPNKKFDINSPPHLVNVHRKYRPFSFILVKKCWTFLSLVALKKGHESVSICIVIAIRAAVLV